MHYGHNVLKSESTDHHQWMRTQVTPTLTLTLTLTLTPILTLTLTLTLTLGHGCDQPPLRR